jgi:hypothetical protein
MPAHDFFPDMLQQWHTFVEQMHSEEAPFALDGMYSGTNYSNTGTATPIRDRFYEKTNISAVNFPDTFIS